MKHLNLDTDSGFTPTTPTNGDGGILCLSSESSGW